MRKLFVKSKCQFCRDTLIPTEEVNLRMPFGKRIETIDCHEWENFKMTKHPIIHKLNFDAYPTMFLDNVKIKGMLSKDQTRAFLDGFMESNKLLKGDGEKWLHN